MLFKVEGRSSNGENVVEEVAARNAKQIHSHPENFGEHGFTKIYKVSPISNRRERGEHRETKYT